MARSIHTTRRELRELSREKFEDSKQKKTALEDAAEPLYRKRRIKRMVKNDRRPHFPPSALTEANTVPIVTRDESDFVHHGASPADVQAILDAIPGSARLGVSRIQLSLGTAFINERATRFPTDRDPYTRRLSGEIFPGVYNGRVLGCYTIESGLVSVFGYVYDRSRIPLPLSLCELYLRLHALKTLVHELAHHHDHVVRTARGRWRSDHENTVEWYAEKMEHQWTNEIILPYLANAYPREVDALWKWVAHRGGLGVALEFFAGDERRTERAGPQRLVFPTSCAFESWVKKLPDCKTLAESRLAFAREIHKCELYDQCLEILNALLARSPDWTTALTCKADTLIRLQRFDEALLAAGRALELDSANANAWKARGDVFECQENWEALLQNTDAWERSGRHPRSHQRELLLHRAVAYCAVDRIPEMEAAIAAHLALFSFKTQEIAGRRKSNTYFRVFRRAGRPAPEQFPPWKP